MTSIYDRISYSVFVCSLMAVSVGSGLATSGPNKPEAKSRVFRVEIKPSTTKIDPHDLDLYLDSVGQVKDARGTSVEVKGLEQLCKDVPKDKRLTIRFGTIDPQKTDFLTVCLALSRIDENLPTFQDVVVLIRTPALNETKK